MYIFKRKVILMEILLSILIGIGLSAACGFRIFTPLLIMSIASISGYLELSHNFQWIGTYPALIVFLVATIIEVLGYYIPWIDNLLDTIATPTAIIAGIIVMASCIQDINPLLKWSLAIIAGGSVSAVVQTGTTFIRGASTGITGGFGNFIVGTVEIIGSLIISIISILFPILSILIVALVMVIIMKKRRHGEKI